MISEAEMVEGSTLAPWDVGPLTRTDIIRYAGASGDFHPQHHDDEYARAAGFPSLFAMGMFPASILATYAVDRLGPTGWHRYVVRFRDQVWPGDTLTCRGRITAVESGEGGRRRVTAELECATAAGLVISAVAEITPDPPV